MNEPLRAYLRRRESSATVVSLASRLRRRRSIRTLTFVGVQLAGAVALAFADLPPWGLLIGFGLVLAQLGWLLLE
ncbi:MAG: hypothetical protein AAFU77_14795 [Myxococcota bacterium]